MSHDHSTTEPSPKTPRRVPQVPERFRVAGPTLFLDRVMTHFIKIGGIGVIAVICAIFVFIFIQIWPLFGGATVEKNRSLPLGEREIVAMGIDEWAELPMFVGQDGQPHFLDIKEGLNNRGWFAVPTGLEEGLVFSAVIYDAAAGNLLLGTADGRFSVVDVTYQPRFLEAGGRMVDVKLSATPLLSFGDFGPIEHLSFGDGGERKLAAAIQRLDGETRLTAVSLEQPRTLLGVGEVKVVDAFDLSGLIEGNPSRLLVRGGADSLLVADDGGKVSYLFHDRPDFSTRQSFRPFGDFDDPTIASMNFILGDVSIVFTHPSGAMRVFSLYPDPETGERLWARTKTFESLKRGAEFYSASLRNKAFLSGAGNDASLRYMTTEDIRWQATLPFEIRQAVLGPRYDKLVFLDTQNTLHLYDLRDPHPQASWRTYFGKIQYEGQAEASYTWQSTGGSDAFEYKLSLVPLIIGTLKGTVFAMMWALPIALLAAIYTSQFLKPELKRYIKPTMEIMASLPSVVLGFLAALWLAPIVSNRVPSVILSISGIILGAFLFGWAWSHLPNRFRMRVKHGWEFALVAPAIFLFAYVGWNLGPVMEEFFFVVTDPETGNRVADFRLWFPTVTGLGFEQRNAFVVGFVMGFAVIPLIFTIAEDAMSNVPHAFRSGSLALGASRWQTAMRVVLPTASAGIFSAVMIGLGRAVGETMIVVMATGNTPVTDFNIFTGMRTLSANIAVELPEAPYLGTLYRTLFLGAMVLFLLTFFVNTLAELMRQRLRDKYRAVE